MGTTLVKYTGSSPTGPRNDQYIKGTSTGASQRPGGYTYTDLVLEGDFTLTLEVHGEGGGGDGYICPGFHEESYTAYTHQKLNGENVGFASTAVWAAYSIPNNKYD